MSGRESTLQKNCMRWCKDKNLVPVNIHGDGWGNKGFPDLLIFGKGKCIAIELKDGTAYKQQPAQKMWQKKLTNAGINCLLIRSFADFIKEVEREFLI